MRTANKSGQPVAAFTKKDFGRALTALREGTGLTVRDLARRVGAPFGTLSGWCTGRHVPTLSQRELFLRLLAECGETDERRVADWVACWLRLRRPLGGQRADDRAPYRGLEAFQAEDADRFFGREQLTDLLVRRVTEGPGGLVVVVGASGSGKSSLLRAGLLPRLCRAAERDTAEHDTADHDVPGREAHRGLLLTPGARPLTALASQLSLLGDAPADEVEAALRAAPEPAARALRTTLAEPVLLVVDQFEEVFTSADEGERAAFLAALRGLTDPSPADRPVTADRSGPADPPGPALRAVLGMRADFYPDALRWPLLATALQDHQVTVAPMTEDETRRAITAPAALAGLEVENGLVDLLLRDLAPSGPHRAGALPLLSHVLLATWERAGGATLGVADYAATGGVHGAVAKTADDVHDALPEPDRELARTLFLRLVHVGDGTPDTRRRVPLDELLDVPEESARVRAVLGRYVDRRLITADVDGVEISHEALIDSWPRLREWIDTDRSGHRLHRRLTEAAKGWQETGRHPDALYRGVRLDAAVEWGARHGGRLNRVEREFVDAGVRAERADRVRERRRTRVLRRLAAALAALLLVAGATAVHSVRQGDRADRERDLAVSRQIAGTAGRLAESDPALAAQLAVAAHRVAPTVEATSALLTAASRPAVSRAVRPNGARQAAVVDPSGTLLAAAGATEADTEVLLWDVRDPARQELLPVRLTGHTGAIYAAAFSPDGRVLATGSADLTVRLWDVADPRAPRPLGEPITGPGKRVLAVAFSPDGTRLAVGGDDRLLRLWDVRDPATPVAGAALDGAGGGVQSIAFTPSGEVAATADASGAVRLHDLVAGRAIGVLPLPSRVNSVAISPDGRVLAAGSNDATVRLWRLDDPAAPADDGVLTGAAGWVNAIAFSSDGALLAAADAGGRATVWNLADRAHPTSLPHPKTATAVAFREGDRVLHTNAVDGVARRWLVPGPVLPTADRQITGLAFAAGRPLLFDGGTDLRLWDLSDRDHPVRGAPALTAPPDGDRMTGGLSLSPDGRTLAAATRSGNHVVLWDVTDPERPVRRPERLTGHTALIEDVRFAHRSDLLASAGDDGTVRLWSTGPAAPLAVLEPGSGFAYAVAFTPDDRLLAAATQGGEVALWDVSTPTAPRSLGLLEVSKDDVRSLSASPDGRTLAVGTATGAVQLWDVTDPAAPVRSGDPITGPDGIVHALAFTPDGGLLAGGAGAGQTWVWRLPDRTPLAILQGAASTTWATRFTPDGALLATASGDVHLWEVDPERAVTRVCANAGDPVTEAEWARHVPGVPYRAVCAR
ncbi:MULTISPECIES: AAA family ATPase [Actinosynnema]|uniref:nSTAND1 domain-containing NTPase n=1 Tax=Actinosynnema TaxID=40566 RepID=UPI0020A579B5|nr:AAA family ATPase [Actinosynnema pretiosum]MCP2094420.1 WD40 repeat [Actinosynnema pretiosum]